MYLSFVIIVIKDHPNQLSNLKPASHTAGLNQDYPQKNWHVQVPHLAVHVLRLCRTSPSSHAAPLGIGQS